MQPLCLTLKGFRGIRDGLGRDVLTLDFERLADGAELVAIGGANGRGKTTVMDNMHPYLTMPSRAALAGPGGFSYYDHVFLPESEKDLTWAHEGRCYRSQVVIRLNGRRRTEAYLLELDDSGVWAPAVIEDGTVSDGKVDTYSRCVEAVCGSADTFFTSVFSAQGKRQLSAYRNGEIKTLLADLLGQEAIRAQGQKAAETARLLKASLGAMRLELAGMDEEAARLAAECHRLHGAGGRVAIQVRARQSAQASLEQSRARHAQLLAHHQQSLGTQARRAQLRAECDAVNQAQAQAIDALRQQAHAEQQRLGRLQQRIAQRVSLERDRGQVLKQRRGECLKVLAFRGAVRHAQRRMPLAERVLEAWSARVLAARQAAQRLTEVRIGARAAEQRLSSTLREAGQAALRAQELLRRHGLTNQVPCAGTDLQGRCQLLGDAREARALMPSAHSAIRRLAETKATIEQELAVHRALLVSLGSAPEMLACAERRCERARAHAARLTQRVAMAGEINQAEANLAALEQELSAVGVAGPMGELPSETPEEAQERAHIHAAQQAIVQRTERQSQQLHATLERLQAALAALPPPFDLPQLADAQSVMSKAAQAASEAEDAHLAAVRDTQALAALASQAAALATRRTRTGERIAHVETELSNWNLFARCMSNDGLIALAIDDAGPTLSALTNDLLQACYGTRFTVSILTLVETGKGEQKEGFDIVVHDADSGQSKSVGLMSGGERVWINECLIRAVALYLAQHAGRHYDTLFSDEADGPLDLERKRMFMAMKREVLRVGGYAREFFVSQTPELTMMADAVIDLDAMVTSTADCTKG